MSPDGKSKNALSRERLAEVVALLLAEGWTNTSRPRVDDGDQWRFVEMRNPDGLAFSFSAGGWHREGMVTARPAHIEEDGLKCGPGDVARGTAPEASASYARPASTILKDLKRRVLESPEGIDSATKVRDGMARLKLQRENLRGHVATMRTLGYREGEQKANETYSVSLTAPGAAPYKVTVYENGRVSFEGSCDIEQFAKVRECLATPKSST